MNKLANPSLSSLILMVTRPDPAGRRLCHLIQQEGGWALHVPAISFKSMGNPYSLQKKINLIQKNDWLIFISPQAVYSAAPLLLEKCSFFPHYLNLATIGKGTAEVLYPYGNQNICFPPTSWNSEGLLHLFSSALLQKKRVFLIRGRGGLNHLATGFAKLGAKIHHLITYQRILPKIIPPDVNTLLKQRAIYATICTSYESVKNIKKMMGKKMENPLLQTPLIVNSKRIKTLASDLGFQTIWTANNASDRSIIQRIYTSL